MVRYAFPGKLSDGDNLWEKLACLLFLSGAYDLPSLTKNVQQKANKANIFMK